MYEITFHLKRRERQKCWITRQDLLVCTCVCVSISVVILLAGQLYSKLIIGNSLSEKSRFNVDRQHFCWSPKLNDWTTLQNGEQDENNEECSKYSSLTTAESNSKLHDRIVEQLLLKNRYEDKIFKLYLPRNGLLTLPTGRTVFLRDKCAVNDCEIVTSKPDEADALLFANADVMPEILSDLTLEQRRAEQIWIAYLLESPPNTFDKRYARKYRAPQGVKFNWTATYRSDSYLVTPYAKFVPYTSHVSQYLYLKKRQSSFDDDDWESIHFQSPSAKLQQLIKAKQNRAAWLVSNCHAHNERLEYARQLNQYFPVDIYGKCGNMTCSKWNQTNCLTMLNENYKFYLSFENTNSRDYITEKLFKNAYGQDLPDYHLHLLLPIVLGTDRNNYERLVPPRSFIHVHDYQSPKELAEWLWNVAADDKLYYKYFLWKQVGRFIDTKFTCRLCAMLHARSKVETEIEDIKQWWWYSLPPLAINSTIV